MNFSFISKNKKIVYLISIVVLFLVYLIISAIAQIGQNKNIDLMLEYKSGTEFDPDNNGVETIGNIIDFTVENSVFNWNPDQSKLCTKWSVNSNKDICYGGGECCSFIGLNSTGNNWNDVFYLNYGRYGASYNNIVSAQIVYVNYSLDVQNPYEEVIYSNVSSLNAQFEKRKVEISTKIGEFDIIPNNVSKGSRVNVHARLFQGDTRFSHHSLGVYIDGSLIGTEITDAVGYIVFELDTSSLTVGNNNVEVRFLGSEVSSDKEIITYLPSSSNPKILLIQGNELILNKNILFQEIKDCKTKYWETEEHVYGNCQKGYTKTICDDYPINKTCHDEIAYRNYTCRKGIQKVQNSKEICTPKELRITRGNEKGRINFGNWGKCSTKGEVNGLTVICDSRYDGNNDGICQSGESCIKFAITENNVKRYLKNSRYDFMEEDDSFFLEKLRYEVVLK